MRKEEVGAQLLDSRQYVQIMKALSAHPHILNEDPLMEHKRYQQSSEEDNFKKKLLQDKSSIMMLQETNFSNYSISYLNNILWKGRKSVALDANQATSGITLLWNPAVVIVPIFLETTSSIYVEFHIIGIEVMGLIMNIYGPHTLT